jgi:hypothetical protein
VTFSTVEMVTIEIQDGLVHTSYHRVGSNCMPRVGGTYGFSRGIIRVVSFRGVQRGECNSINRRI